MRATPRELAMWENGFVSGQEDLGCVLLAMLIEDGRVIVKLNELSDMIVVAAQLPQHYLPEHVLEVMQEIRREKNAIQPDDRN